MRVLQVLWDGGGNTAPQLAIARTLVGRGHDVQILANRCQQEKAEATGADFRAFRHAPDHDASSPETDILRDWDARTPIGAFARIRDNLMFGPSLLFARDAIDALEESGADVVVWDYILLGTGIGAERAGVLSVPLFHNIYPVPTDGVPPFGLGFPPAAGPLGRFRDAAVRKVLIQLFRPGLAAANSARAELGLPEHETPFDQFARADRALILTSPEFDFAGTAKLPENTVFTGPVLDSRDPGGWESPWPPDDDRPLVLSSFSTTYMDQRDLAERVIAALAELPVRGLLTTGPAIDPAGLPRPDNVEIREFVPHAAVLPEASLAVTHAGLGTVHAALAAGVPLVCMPDGRDQPDTAARVVFHGAGLRTGKGASARKLRRVIGEVLAEPFYKSSAERMAEAFGRENGAERAADELEALAS